MTMNAQNATYQGAALPAKFRRGLVRNVVALCLAFLSVGIYARASAELGASSTLCDASGAAGVGVEHAGGYVAR
jgi:hypothetical protein